MSTKQQLLTGAVTVVRCPYCLKTTREFQNSNQARHYVLTNGWLRYKNKFVCPECALKHPKIFDKK